MKLGNTVFCLLLLGGLSTSCIREDLSDCFSTNTLLLSYKGDGETEIFGDKICRVEMFSMRRTVALPTACFPRTKWRHGRRNCRS